MKAPFRVIVADPPWSYADRKEHRRDNPQKATKFGIGVRRRYAKGCMPTQDICDLGPLVGELCAPNAYLFLWTTCPHLPDALRVMQSWGFHYSSVGFQWIKVCKDGITPTSGPGNYTFSNAEIVLFGVRAKKNKRWHQSKGYKPNQIVLAPHPRGADKKIIQSAKPEEVQDRIERWLVPSIGDAGMLELFARRQRDGWRCMGGDVSGLDIREELAPENLGAV